MKASGAIFFHSGDRKKFSFRVCVCFFSVLLSALAPRGASQNLGSFFEATSNFFQSLEFYPGQILSADAAKMFGAIFDADISLCKATPFDQIKFQNLEKIKCVDDDDSQFVPSLLNSDLISIGTPLTGPASTHPIC